ncbi:MAG: hypothetical protein H0X24_24510 [Ktedonobacterales bacterium]|nr:hypothetical protein [Ktedonobacterales bacterium]
MANEPHLTVLDDILQGAIRGDFAPEMGGAGRLTQLVFGFIPGISTVCALRDLIADHQQHDNLGAALNAVAMLPVVGGVSKVAAVVRAARRMGRAARAARLLARPAAVKPLAERQLPPAWPV